MPDEQALARAKRIIDRSKTKGHFSSEIGCDYESVSVQSGVGYLLATKENCNPYGIMHGGAYYTLMDQLAGMAACCGGRQAVTIDANINYIKSAVLGEKVRCEVNAVQIGGSITVYEGRCYGEDGSLQCTGTFHLYYLKRPTFDV